MCETFLIPDEIRTTICLTSGEIVEVSGYESFIWCCNGTRAIGWRKSGSSDMWHLACPLGALSGRSKLVLSEFKTQATVPPTLIASVYKAPIETNHEFISSLRHALCDSVEECEVAIRVLHNIYGGAFEVEHGEIHTPLGTLCHGNLASNC